MKNIDIIQTKNNMLMFKEHQKSGVGDGETRISDVMLTNVTMALLFYIANQRPGTSLKNTIFEKMSHLKVTRI